MYPGLKAYKLANPFFTEKGDLFLEMYDFDQSPVFQSSTALPGLRVPGRPALSRPSPIKSRGTDSALSQELVLTLFVSCSVGKGGFNRSTPTTPTKSASSPFTTLPTITGKTPGAIKLASPVVDPTSATAEKLARAGIDKEGNVFGADGAAHSNGRAT